MKGKKVLYQLLAVALVFATMLAPVATPATAVAVAGDHVMYIDGTSSISGYCQYEWKKDGAGEPIRDELGIPQPTTLPPTCRTGPQTGCTLQRNLGTYKPYWRAADATKGEVGLNPPCAGQISAATDQTPASCFDATNGDLSCRINAPTWFYGYCGQTYGGATGGSIRFNNGQSWTIDKMGFPRGRGAWEFSGKISHHTGGSSKLRFYFAAAPNKPEEAAACDTGGNLSQITFNGIAIISTQLPVRLIRTKPGWHFCTDDPILGGGDIC